MIDFPSAPPNGGKTHTVAIATTHTMSHHPNFNQGVLHCYQEIFYPIKPSQNANTTPQGLADGHHHFTKAVKTNSCALYKFIDLANQTPTATTEYTNSIADFSYIKTSHTALDSNFSQIYTPSFSHANKIMNK